MNRGRQTLISTLALIVGLGLLAFTLLHTDLRSTGVLVRQLGVALPLALVPSAAWHVLRTMAWRQCFPSDVRLSFARIFRVRLAAEAFSFVTVRGVAGEPLKVILLEPDVAPAISAASVALERVAYLFITAGIVAAAALIALGMLPLTPGWIRLFRGVAGAALLMVVAPIVILLRGRSASAPPVSPRPSSSARGLARFMRTFNAQFSDIVRGDRRRLISLLTLEASAYLMMALEVWVVLRVAHAPVTVIGAMAVESFTRVASMVSAFIPANLGALEASNVAGATAVHAVGGAAALALVRRLRGIIWCVAGFLIYPRTRKRNMADDRGCNMLAVIEDSDSDVSMSDRLGGLPLGERIVRAAVRAGYTRVLVWTRREHAQWRALAKTTDAVVDLIPLDDPGDWQRQVTRLRQTPITVLAPGVVASPQLLAAARKIMPNRQQPAIAVPAGAGWPQSGVFRTLPDRAIAPDGLAAQLSAHDDAPWPDGRDVSSGRALSSLRVTSRAQLPEAERRLRESIFKPTDKFFARFNRHMSIPISVALIRWTRFSANAMSVLLIVLGIYAGWLFSRGDYVAGIYAALVSLAASVLDGCDGELARLQYKDSAFGCWLDTFGDYTYYVAVFAGLTVGAVRQTGWSGFWWIGGASLAGSLLTIVLLSLLRERITGDRPERLQITTKAHFYGTGKPWARLVARLPNCATRATMPYGILGFAVVSLLPLIVVLAAVGAQIYWISLAVEARRLLDAPRGSPAPVSAATGV